MDLQNILFNLNAGMPIECLSANEIETLTKEYGVDWKVVLGYEG